MPEIIIHKMGDGAFADFKDRKIIHLGAGAPPIRIAVLERGMTSGKTSVAIGFELLSGEVVLAETSLKIFLAAADTLRGLDRDMCR